MTDKNANPSKKERTARGKQISRMVNSVLYFLRWVFIIKEANEFRLVIIKEKSRLFDVRYKTMRGAKVACSNLIRERGYSKEIKPDWSFFYPVDEEWLIEKLG